MVFLLEILACVTILNTKMHYDIGIYFQGGGVSQLEKYGSYRNCTVDYNDRSVRAPFDGPQNYFGALLQKGTDWTKNGCSQKISCSTIWPLFFLSVIVKSHFWWKKYILSFLRQTCRPCILLWSIIKEVRSFLSGRCYVSGIQFDSAVTYCFNR